MNKSQRKGLTAIAFVAACAAQVALAAEASLPAHAKILDPDIIFHSWPYPTISPDGLWVTYISKGYVCVCNITNPTPLRLFEVPNSWTHFLARPEHIRVRGDSGALFRILGQDKYNKLTADVTSTVYGLRWTPNGDALVFGVQSYKEGPTKPTYDMWHVSIDHKVTNLSHVGPPDSLINGVCDAILTRDGKYLVASSYDKARIWNVTTNKPRAAPFLNLTPSPSSGRWIGIEKDTGQLVITDEDFNVVKRFDEFRPAWSFGLRLDWSADERFVILRNQIGFDYYSNWEGFWMNLDTGEKRELKGRFMDEQIEFTGSGGEFVRCGQDGVQAKWSGDQITGAHLTIVPGDAKTPPKDVWRLVLDQTGRTPGALTNRPGNPPMRPSPERDLFAICLPRPAGKTSGWIWHLIDRDGNKWQFPGNDTGEFISPYEVVDFANGGDTIVAYDKQQLFVIPVKCIKDSSNKLP